MALSRRVARLWQRMPPEESHPGDENPHLARVVTYTSKTSSLRTRRFLRYTKYLLALLDMDRCSPGHDLGLFR